MAFGVSDRPGNAGRTLPTATSTCTEAGLGAYHPSTKRARPGEERVWQRRRHSRPWSHLGIAVALPFVASGSLIMAHAGAWAFIPMALFAVPSALLGVPWCLVVAFLHLKDNVQALPVARQGLEVDVFLDHETGASKVFVVHPERARARDRQMRRVAVTAPMRAASDGAALSDIERAELGFIVARVERRIRIRWGLAGILSAAMAIIALAVTRSVLQGAGMGVLVVAILALITYYWVRSDVALRQRLRADVEEAALVHLEGTQDRVLQHSALLWQRANYPGPERCRGGGLADPRFASEPFSIPRRGRPGF